MIRLCEIEIANIDDILQDNILGVVNRPTSACASFEQLFPLSQQKRESSSDDS